VPRRAKAWTTALTERLIELRADGISNAEIAATLKRPLDSVAMLHHLRCDLSDLRLTTVLRGLPWPRCHSRTIYRSPSSSGPSYPLTQATGIDA